MSFSCYSEALPSPLQHLVCELLWGRSAVLAVVFDAKIIVDATWQGAMALHYAVAATTSYIRSDQQRRQEHWDGFHCTCYCSYCNDGKAIKASAVKITPKNAHKHRGLYSVNFNDHTPSIPRD